MGDANAWQAVQSWSLWPSESVHGSVKEGRHEADSDCDCICSELDDDSGQMEVKGCTMGMRKGLKTGKPRVLQKPKCVKKHSLQCTYTVDSIIVRTNQSILMWTSILMLLRKPPKLAPVQALCISILNSHRCRIIGGVNRLANFANSCQDRAPQCAKGLLTLLLGTAANSFLPQMVSTTWHPPHLQITGSYNTVEHSGMLIH